jgi:glucose-1-phosphate thymidylyltransferase
MVTPTPIVLAAGPGSRLWPLTKARPKPMVPVAGRPIVEWCLDSLASAGLEQATVVVGHKASTIQAHLQDGSELGLDLTYVHQDQQLGSGHALATALEAEGLPEAALVVGADNVIEPRLVEALVDEGPDAIGVTKSEAPSRYGVVTRDGDRVADLTEKPLVEGEALISTGSYLLDRRTLDAVPRLVEEGTTDLPEILASLIEEGHAIEASVTSGQWHDAVYPWDLVSLTEHLFRLRDPAISDAADLARDATVRGAVQVGGGARLGPSAVVDGPASLHPNVRLKPAAQVGRSLLLDGSKLGRGVVVEKSVLGEGVTVGAGATLGAGPATVATGDDQVHDLERIGAVVGEGTTIGPGAVLEPGTRVGANATVAPGARVRGRVPDGGWVQ